MGSTTHMPHHGKEQQKWTGNQQQPERPQAPTTAPAAPARPEQKMGTPSRERGHGQKHK